MPRIKMFSIHAFRGIPYLELDLEGKSLFLKGENATGKSSIVEAFEFFFTGNLSIFQGEGTQSLSLQRHTPHKNFEKEDVSIKIAFDPGNIALERRFENEPVPPAQLERYFKAAQKGTFVLRRSQILKFIATVPSERFRAIASIIGVERLDDIELTMKRAYEELDNTVTSKQNRIKEIFSNISQHLGGNIADAKQALDSVNTKLKEVNLTQLKSFDRISQTSDYFLKTLKKSADLEHIMKLNEIIEELGQFHIEDEISKYLHDLNVKLKPLLEERSKRELFLRDFLTKSQQAVEKDERNVCPLCGQEVDRQKLLEQIKARLQTLSKLSEEATEVRQLSSNLEDALKSLLESVENVSSRIKPFKQLDRVRSRLLKTIKSLTELRDNIKLAKELKLEKEISVEEFKETKATIEKLVKSAYVKCEKEFKKIGVSDDWKTKMDVINLANRIASLLTN